MVRRHRDGLSQHALKGGFDGAVIGHAALEEDVIADGVALHHLGDIVRHDGIGQAADHVLFTGAVLLVKTKL